jgi:LCP family protein required for cell wall assembly
MKKSHDRNKIIKCSIIVLSVIFLISAALLLLEMWEDSQNQYPITRNEDSTIVYDGKEYQPKFGVETFLVLGLDKFEGDSLEASYNNNEQADLLMLFVFDNRAKTCSAIQINRDTMAPVHVLGVDGSRVDTLTKQIALAHTYGKGDNVSCRNTADSVSELLSGVKVNHYLSLKMDAVPILNDAVGGVEVTVLEDLTNKDESLVQGKTVTLKGEQAIHYVRTRAGLDDSTNLTRMERQRQYMDALYQRLTESMAQDENFLVETTLEIADYMVSNESVTQLQEMARKFNDYEFTGIIQFEGETKKGEKFMEFYPDENALSQIVVDLFYTPKE